MNGARLFITPMLDISWKLAQMFFVYCITPCSETRKVGITLPLPLSKNLDGYLPTTETSSDYLKINLDFSLVQQEDFTVRETMKIIKDRGV